MGINDGRYRLDDLTTDGFAGLLQGDRPVVVILPVGSVEPHGPHLSLVTDTIISDHAAVRAAEILERKQLTPLIAPAVPYGVTNCASSFKGAVSIAAESLTDYLRSVVDGFLANGVAHVCLVNNHLEPDHEAAVRDAIRKVGRGKASVASPLTKRWARTLSDEFKRGACHAGKYETSIVMATEPKHVDETTRKALPEVPVSLSDKLSAGVTDFVDMGLDQAYAGAPAEATVDHGNKMLERLAIMIATEVFEALGRES